jgi:DNA-directed RNA polymerase subunit M/transcription elongation factor TFIIS
MSSMSFCRSCNNMLYPKEDKAAKRLMYACRGCGYEQEADNPIVFKHEIIKSAKWVPAGRAARRRARLRKMDGAPSASHQRPSAQAQKPAREDP